jgi:hypothetical protein
VRDQPDGVANREALHIVAGARPSQQDFRGQGALVHFLSCERNDPGPIPLCDDPCPADGMRAPGLEHPVQHRDADDRLGLLSVETACS